MKTKPVLFLAGALLALACRGNDGKAVRKDQQYDVVQEGQASGVTSTINGPGEPAPVASAPLSGTNADTTTNLALPTDSAGNVTQGQPGTLASTLPATGGSMATPATPPAMPPAGASPRPRVVTSTPQPMTSSSTVTPAARPAPQQTRRTPRAQPATDTQAAPPPTDTTTTQPPATDTKPPKDSSTKSEARPEKEKTDTSTSPQPAPPTDTQPPPPPPPVV